MENKRNGTDSPQCMKFKKPCSIFFGSSESCHIIIKRKAVFEKHVELIINRSCEVTVVPLVKKFKNICVNTLPIENEQSVEDTDLLAIDTRIFRINIDKTEDHFQPGEAPEGDSTEPGNQVRMVSTPSSSQNKFKSPHNKTPRTPQSSSRSNPSPVKFTTPDSASPTSFTSFSARRKRNLTPASTPPSNTTPTIPPITEIKEEGSTTPTPPSLPSPSPSSVLPTTSIPDQPTLNASSDSVPQQAAEQSSLPQPTPDSDQASDSSCNPPASTTLSQESVNTDSAQQQVNELTAQAQAQEPQSEQPQQQSQPQPQRPSHDSQQTQQLPQQDEPMQPFPQSQPSHQSPSSLYRSSSSPFNMSVESLCSQSNWQDPAITFPISHSSTEAFTFPTSSLPPTTDNPPVLDLKSVPNTLDEVSSSSMTPSTEAPIVPTPSSLTIVSIPSTTQSAPTLSVSHSGSMSILGMLATNTPLPFTQPPTGDINGGVKVTPSVVNVVPNTSTVTTVPNSTPTVNAAPASTSTSVATPAKQAQESHPTTGKKGKALPKGELEDLEWGQRHLIPITTTTTTGTSARKRTQTAFYSSQVSTELRPRRLAATAAAREYYTAHANDISPHGSGEDYVSSPSPQKKKSPVKKANKRLKSSKPEGKRKKKKDDSSGDEFDFVGSDDEYEEVDIENDSEEDPYNFSPKTKKQKLQPQQSQQETPKKPPQKRAQKRQEGTSTTLKDKIIDILDTLDELKDDRGFAITSYFQEMPCAGDFKTLKEWKSYQRMIPKIMSLSAIREKAENPQTTYTTAIQFIDDVSLVVSNAMRYNAPGSDAYKDAARLKQYFDKYLISQKLTD